MRKARAGEWGLPPRAGEWAGRECPGKPLDNAIRSAVYLGPPNTEAAPPPSLARSAEASAWA